MYELIEILRRYFQEDNAIFEFNCFMFLAGDHNKAKRIELIELLTGSKRPATKCGFHACVNELTHTFNQPTLF